MQPLNALDALAPAFTRTHQLLFAPFKIGRSWKLAASAYVAFMGSVFVPIPLLLLGAPIPFSSRVVAAVVLFLPTFVLLAFFYLGVRMQSVHFEMVVTKSKFIAPMWGRYGTSSWSWLGLKVALGTAVSLLAAPMLFARGRVMLQGLLALAPQVPRPPIGVQPDPAAYQQAVMEFFGKATQIAVPFYLAMIAVFLLLKFLSSVLEDFALPFAILDEVSVPKALRSGANVIAADPFQTVLFYLIKFMLAVMGFIAQFIVSQVILIPVGIVAVILGGIAGLITLAFESSATHHAIALGVFTAVTFAVTLVAALWAQIFTLGYLLTLLQAYAIYFLGGRYQKLGDYLEPPTYTYTPPPSLPQDDDESGPSLPMDPALV